MSLIAGARDREREHAANFVGIEARMLEVHCGEEGMKAAAALRARALEILFDVDDNEKPAEDECDDLDLDPESRLAAAIIDDREFREAEQYYADNPIEEDVGDDDVDGDE